MSSQYTIYLAPIESVHHFPCLCPVSTPSHLPMSCQNSTLSAHYQSEYDIYCPRPISTLLIISVYTCPAQVQSIHNQFKSLSCLSMASQYTISPAHVWSVHHLSCPSLVSTPCHLTMSSENTTVPVHVQTERHLACALSP